MAEMPCLGSDTLGAKVGCHLVLLPLALTSSKLASSPRLQASPYPEALWGCGQASEGPVVPAVGGYLTLKRTAAIDLAA